MFKRAFPDMFITGFAGGLLLPVIIFFGVYIFSGDGMTLEAYTGRILSENILSHVISLCVFPNVILFLVFNHFDRLRSARGVLGITIIWALGVFAIKLL